MGGGAFFGCARVSYTVDERPIALTHTHSLTHAPTHSLSVRRRQIMSGTCSILIGLVWELPLWVTVLVSLVWGFSIVADSAQFSAIVIEVAEQAYVGTAVTAQVLLMGARVRRGGVAAGGVSMSANRWEPCNVVMTSSLA